MTLSWLIRTATISADRQRDGALFVLRAQGFTEQARERSTYSCVLVHVVGMAGWMDGRMRM